MLFRKQKGSHIPKEKIISVCMWHTYVSRTYKNIPSRRLTILFLKKEQKFQILCKNKLHKNPKSNKVIPSIINH